WFQDAEIVLERLEQHMPDTLIATVTTSFTVSKRTLHNVFPNLCSSYVDEEKSKKDFILDNLLGQRIVMSGWVRFQWDCIFGHFTGITDESDMLTPMLCVVGDLEDVSV
ncbi:hypothetical protein PHYSODRAFT_452112, partial [Phytophthora sojae]